MLMQQHHCNIVHGLTPLLHGIGCILSEKTVGAKTTQVVRSRVPGLKFAMPVALFNIVCTTTSSLDIIVRRC